MIKKILKTLSAIGLALTLVPAFLVFSGTISNDMCKYLMLTGTVLWFLSSPFLGKRTKEV